MTTNSQNTYAGGGEPIVARLGNSVLDAITSLSNIGISTANQIGMFADSALIARMRLDQLRNPPNQNLPVNQITSPSDYLSNPENVSNILKILFLGSAIAVGSWYLIKKAR